MTRGAIRPTTRKESVQRAFAMLTAVPYPPNPSVDDAGNKPISYRLTDYNGGKDPYAMHCADWSYGGRTPTADCVGLVLWCSGIDRLQPSYKGSRGEWLNCQSLIDDSVGDRLYCEPVIDELAIAGDWLVTGSHIAIIVRPAIYVGGVQTFDHVVIDCSPRHGRSTAVGVGGPWSEACRVLRYKGYVP